MNKGDDDTRLVRTVVYYTAKTCSSKRETKTNPC